MGQCASASGHRPDRRQLTQLNDQAAALGVRAEDLAKAAVLDLLTKPANDFREVAERVLAKNTELHHRLG
jgi:hypothetical protein